MVTKMNVWMALTLVMLTTQQSVWIHLEVSPALVQVVRLETASKLRTMERAALTLTNVLLALLVKLIVHAVQTQTVIIASELSLVPVSPDFLV